MNKVIQAIRNPGKAKWYIQMQFKGFYYRLKYKLSRRNVTIGRKFMVSGRFHIVGPGRVLIGDNVQFWGKVTPWTYSKDAEINIGNNVILDGTRFGCRENIRIGDNCMIGECRLLDTDFHSVYPGVRNDPKYVLSAPIIIGKNVWMTINCVVTKGVRIGDGATITPNSVVFTNVPDNCIYGGNPAKLIKKVENLPPKENIKTKI